jgi:hypothetical protein
MMMIFIFIFIGTRRCKNRDAVQPQQDRHNTGLAHAFG